MLGVFEGRIFVEGGDLFRFRHFFSFDYVTTKRRLWSGISSDNHIPRLPAEGGASMNNGGTPHFYNSVLDIYG